jgi:anti-repressor protein
MDELKVFQSDDFRVRIIEKNGELWFHAGDSCKNLDLENVGQTLTRLDEDEKDEIISNDVTGRKQNMWFVTESGLYSLVLSSRKPEAKEFKRWITHDVIPSIRQNGTYSISVKDSYIIEDPIGRAKRWIEEAQERKQLADTIEEQRPKVIFADAVGESNNSILVGDLAKILKQNGIEIGEQRLFKWFRDNGYLGKIHSYYNKPTQKAMEAKLFVFKEFPVFHNSGNITAKFTPKITGKGQRYFVDKFLNLTQEKVI